MSKEIISVNVWLKYIKEMKCINECTLNVYAALKHYYDLLNKVHSCSVNAKCGERECTTIGRGDR
jgi:hypothetical protein